VSAEDADPAEQPKAPGSACRLRMRTERFEEMLRDLGFFPHIVQQHSAKMHILAAQDRCGNILDRCGNILGSTASGHRLITSAGRRRRTLIGRADPSGARPLSYESFLLCICRISFVYLSVYGNSIQQASSSKRKCLWMLTFLRVKTSGTSPQCAVGEDIWNSRCTCNLDAMPLKSLVLQRLFHEI